MSLRLDEFHVSETFGFVLENPLAALPDYFEPWNQLAREMPELVAQDKMRQEVDKMPLLEWTNLSGHREKRLAHFQLTIIASGYVWQHGDSGASKSIPACVAVPLYHVSEELGLQPILGHPGLALANWARINPNGPVSLENLRCLYHLPGGKESEWFFIVTTMIELTFAQCIKSILSGVHGTQSGDEGVVLASLQHITDTVKQMKVVLSHMHDKLSADTFFNIIRPYLGGWGGENNPLPHGLVYEGVSDQPIQAIGGSAAQSTTLQALDALLGVEHADVEKKNFLLKMRSYMPPDHCRFVEAIENQPKKLRDFVFSSKNKELQTVYNACVSAIVDFRSYHIQIVTKYIVQASAKAKQAEGKRFESLDKKGTGGTSIMPFLKTLRDDTRNQCIPTGISENGDQ
ncbi:hypothetical protein BaRGS_00014320 [Batillaria attramentaria]|uniref:Indoleamine 2,3-dioxygenase n=1 Tax=Batillaria attramentaria TaxID=370345 RepID=A0ABD0L593_9CAEN